jgi:DNA (cytosine-5)-methyltransferase 1
MKKTKPVSRKPYRVLSLFSGAGGFDAGLHATARYKTVACVEMSRDCCQTLRKNKRAGRLNRDCKVIELAIGAITPAELMTGLKIKPGEIDLVAGGPPCQPYSGANDKRQGDKCALGKMIWRYLDIVQAVQPKFFLFENVEGFLDFPLSSEAIKGKRIPLVEKFVKRAMRKPGRYSVQGWVLSAADYGAPQDRRRLILMGNRIGTTVKMRGTHAPPELAEESDCLPWVTVRDAIGDLREGPGAMGLLYPKRHHRVFKLMTAPVA